MKKVKLELTMSEAKVVAMALRDFCGDIRDSELDRSITNRDKARLIVTKLATAPGAVKPPKPNEKQLWAYNWKGGGYNQTYARSREEALRNIDIEFANKQTGAVSEKWCASNAINLRSLDTNEAQVYWASISGWD